jgi:hypothetical protein
VITGKRITNIILPVKIDKIIYLWQCIPGFQQCWNGLKNNNNRTKGIRFMSAHEALKQFVWMVFSGAVSTAIGIVAARHTGTWWAGLVGVPIALLLCDVQKSIAAIKFVGEALHTASVEGIGGFRTKAKNYLREHMPVISPEVKKSFVAGAYVVCVIGGGVGLILFGALTALCLLEVVTGSYEAPGEMYAMILLLMVAGFIVGAISKGIYRISGPLTFPITDRLMACGLGRKMRHFLYNSSSNDITDQPLPTSLRDKDGNLWSWQGFSDVCREGFAFVALPYVLILIAFLFPITILDTFLTALLAVSTRRSIALALGVIIGFSADYFLCPPTVTSLVGCSLLGGLSGWGLWILKQRLSRPSSAALQTA